MTTLAQYQRARAALAKATRVDEILPALDEVKHVKLYARQINDHSLLADATEFEERAERRLGEVITAAKEAGHFSKGRPDKCSNAEHLIAKLSEVGVDRKLSARAQKAAALSAEAFEAVVERLKQRIASGSAKLVDRTERQAEKKHRRQAREAELGAKLLALPDKRYGVILADPPWAFKPYSSGTGMDRAADNHYPTSALEQICALDVASITAPDCALFLWATVPMLLEALDVMDAWGFSYRSHCVWIKGKVGTGYWFRNNHELLLVGVRGDIPAPAPGDQSPSALVAAVGKHSVKPETFHQVIEHYFPTLPKIELYRRGAPRPGWDAWGFEAELPVRAAE